MGRHSQPSKVKKVVRNSCTAGAITGTALGAIALGSGSANAFPNQAGLVQCESGGNPHAVNNTAAGRAAGRPAGLFQIVTGTWLANGGGQFAPTADQATPAQQQIVADRIYARQGYSPWECHPGPGPAAFSNYSGSTSGGGPVSAPKPQPPAPHHVAPPQPIVTPEASGITYKVIAGDTLFAIANRFHVSVDDIFALNRGALPSGPDHLVIGVILKLPKGAHVPAPPPAPKPPPAPAPPPAVSAPVTTTADTSSTPKHEPGPGKYYVVKDGDSLWRIASSQYGHGYEWNKIFDLNHDKIQNPNLIFPGQQLAL